MTQKILYTTVVFLALLNAFTHTLQAAGTCSKNGHLPGSIIDTQGRCLSCIQGSECQSCHQFYDSSCSSCSCGVAFDGSTYNGTSRDTVSVDDADFGYQTHSIIIPRSIGANTARELVGWQDYINRFCPERNYITVAQSAGYTRSYKPQFISRTLFGDSTLVFSGSQVEDRSPCDIIADNFGLSPNFKGEISFRPVIENFFIDNQLYIGLDCIQPGLYARIHAPLAHTRWSLNMCERALDNSSNEPFAPCIMSMDEVAPAHSIKQALSGNFVFGDMKEPWHYGKFSPCTLTKTRLADIDLILGHNPIVTPYSHIGLYGQLVLPTGNKPNARYIFEPIVGNGGHFEAGAGISAHLVVWQGGCNDTLAVYLEGNVTHLFENRQQRSFDLCKNGPLSRYLLLKELNSDGKYAHNLVSGINFTTRTIRSRVSVKGDASVKVAYRADRLLIDVGYNFYGNTQEKVCFIKSQCNRDAQRLVGIKGTEGVCYREFSTRDSGASYRSFNELIQEPTLNATQSRATLRSRGFTNHRRPAPTLNETDIAVTATSRYTGSIEDEGVEKAYVSQPPVTLKTRHLDKESGSAPAQATHKLFGYIGYTFEKIPSLYCADGFIGIGAEVEFDALGYSERNSINQWSTFIKGGLAF
jgi:hypothetical protein